MSKIEKNRLEIVSLIELVLSLNDPPVIARERAGRIAYQICAKLAPLIDEARREGKQEVVEWVDRYSWYESNPVTAHIGLSSQAWSMQKKEWGLAPLKEK